MCSDRTRSKFSPCIICANHCCLFAPNSQYTVPVVGLQTLPVNQLATEVPTMCVSVFSYLYVSEDILHLRLFADNSRHVSHTCIVYMCLSLTFYKILPALKFTLEHAVGRTGWVRWCILQPDCNLSKMVLWSKFWSSFKDHWEWQKVVQSDLGFFFMCLYERNVRMKTEICTEFMNGQNVCMHFYGRQ